MKRASLFLFLWAMGYLFTRPLQAEEAPRVDFFAGYSYFRTNSAQGLPSGNLNGGIGSFAYNTTPHLAIEGEFGGYHNNAEVDNTSLTFMFGPRISYGRTKKVDPFIHILFGGIHSSIKVETTSSLIPKPLPVPPPPASAYTASQANFGLVAGGGLDFHLSGDLYIRVAQFDYLLTRFEAPSVLNPTGATSNRNSNNFRFAAGIGLEFGAR